MTKGESMNIQKIISSSFPNMIVDKAFRFENEIVCLVHSKKVPNAKYDSHFYLSIVNGKVHDFDMSRAFDHPKEFKYAMTSKGGSDMNYSEWLMHFNDKHDPRNGQFARKNGSSSISRKEKKQAIKRLKEEQDKYFRDRISEEAAKVTRLGANGYDQRGSKWNDAYKKGKVTSKDDREIKAAAKATRDYMDEKYGKELRDALSKSGVLGVGTKSIDEYISKYGGMKIKDLLQIK